VASATYESGHFYFAQTGHSHFSATVHSPYFPKASFPTRITLRESLMDLAIGTRLDRYEIVGTLGAGGMGEVYRAFDTRIRREVAVKILPEAFAADENRLVRFQQEARTVGALNHPNILSVHDFGAQNGIHYMVTELLDGGTLRQKLVKGALSPRRAIEYSIQIAQGLASAHERGVVHRDLKPENVFVTADGLVKILDFGLAKACCKTHGSTP
jgi:serine/threonine protein kinase